MIIELDNLVHAYPTGEEALRGITLTIEGTEPVAIIGQNGAGKTTLVKHLNGILKPTRGDVRINGISVTAQSTAAWSKTVGYVFQNPDDQLFLESVRKEFEFGPQHIGLDETQSDQRIAEIAELVGLADKLEINPFDLAPAEKKFCAIGAVLMMNPDILVFDEPTCGQDVAGNERLARIIAWLRERGKLCITISHDMKFVVRNFSRAIVLCCGQVLLDGSIEEVFKQVDTLKQSYVVPPPITRVAQAAGLAQTLFDVSDVVAHIQREVGNK